MTAVGIDFGTSNSVVALWEPGGARVVPIDTPPGGWTGWGFERVLPSVMARLPDGSALFGWAAKTADVEGYPAVKRLFATQQDTMADDAGAVLEVEQVATSLFRLLASRAGEQGVDVQRAVVTIPANSRGLARHRTRICAAMAGIHVLALINEPTAAAMAYSARHPGDRQLLVFDWGGGTLDVTILQSVDGVFIEQASKGLPTRGGMDFDARLEKVILDTVEGGSTGWTAPEKARFRTEVELAKVMLSRQEEVVVGIPGRDPRRVTRPMFDDAVRSLIGEARDPIEQCFIDIGVSPSAIDAVVMVGGTSQVPAVRHFVADLLGRAPEVGIDPMTAVGEGAAIAAAILEGELADNDFFVGTEHALGTISHDRVGGRGQFAVIIPRNHKLPARRTQTFSPLTVGQEMVAITVVEGDPELPIGHPDNVVLNEWRVPLPAEADDIVAADRSFEMTFEYDVEGILHVAATDNATGATMLEDRVSYIGTADRHERHRIAKQANEIVDQGRLEHVMSEATAADEAAVALLKKAAIHYVPFLDGDDRQAVEAAILDLERAGPDEVDDRKRDLQRLLDRFPYLAD
jgi:molecular chaperone DnaK (HSP70)